MPFPSCYNVSSLRGQAVWMLQLMNPLPVPWEAPFGCTLEDTKEEGLVELIRLGSTAGWVSFGSMESLSGVWIQHFPEAVLPRTFPPPPHYNLLYLGLHSFDNVIHTP